MTRIPDSWEYVAGDVHEMGGRQFRNLDRFPGRKVPVSDITQPRKPKPHPEHPSMYGTGEGWDVQPYVPTPEPSELHSQPNLEALENAGFQSIDRNAWQRHIISADGENLGTHYIFRSPGNKILGGKSAPWHFAQDEESAGIPHATLRGPGGALATADKHVQQIRNSLKSEAAVFPHWTKFGDLA